MLRAALLTLGTLSLVAVPSCGSKSDAPAVQPGAVAGKVIEVTGTVKAGATPLAVGDSVKTDDMIETGADGNVVIELLHNQARWELGPNNKKKPTDSLAWTAAKATGSAVATQEQTSAAGRPAERSAADGASSAAKQVPVAPTTPPTSGEGAAPGRGGASPNGTMSATPAPPAPPPSPAASHSAPSPSAASSETVERSDDAMAAPKKRKAEAIDPLQSLASCLPTGTSLALEVHIANHVPSVTFASGVDSKIQACITSAAKKLVLTAASGDLEVSLTR